MEPTLLPPSHSGDTIHKVQPQPLTTVWTSFILWCLILLMMPAISTFPSLATCSRARSMVMNVPVRPTPALRKRERERERERVCVCVCVRVCVCVCERERERERERAQHLSKLKAARHQCHENLWRFTRDLLDDDAASGIQPTFSESEATSYFSSIYQSEPHSFTRPSWLPPASTPMVDFNEEDISMVKIVRAVNGSRVESAPSPVDGIPYSVFKKCPAVLSWLLSTTSSTCAVPCQLFRRCGSMHMSS